MLCSFVRGGRKQYHVTHEAPRGTKKSMDFLPDVRYWWESRADPWQMPYLLDFEAINIHILDQYAKRRLEFLRPANHMYEMALRMEELLTVMPDSEFQGLETRASSDTFRYIGCTAIGVLVKSRLYVNINTIATQFPDFVLPDSGLRTACEAAGDFHRAVLAERCESRMIHRLSQFDAVCKSVQVARAIDHLHRIIEAEKQNRMLNVMLGRHVRLGERSLLRHVPGELLQTIVKEAMEEDDPAEYAESASEDGIPCIMP